MATKPTTIPQFLATVRPEQRAVLQKLRQAIRTVAPKATECLCYGVPSFRLNGKFLLSFAASRNHCALYPGAAAIRAHARELINFSLSKGTVRFTPEHPLPVALVRKLVKARVAAVAHR